MTNHSTELPGGEGELDELVEELLLQPPALVTYDELADYKKRVHDFAKREVLKALISELQHFWDIGAEHGIDNRLVELQAELTALYQPTEEQS